MGNLITNNKAPGEPYLKLSNGSTAVLISVLLLSGSDMARDDWERSLVTWLGEHDQSIFGRGVVGFDLDQIAWESGRFAEQQAFVLAIIDRAIERHRWELLDYDPPFVQDQLRVLRSLVEQYQVEFVEGLRQWNWRARPERFEKCPIHQVYMHAYGCAICNDS